MPSPCDLVLHAACIVTQNPERATCENGTLAIKGGRVAAVGPRADIAPLWRGEREMDLGNMLVLPGLVNAHTHAAMTFLRGLADDLPLMEWLNGHVFPVERHLTPEIVEWSCLLGYAEMLRTGTTACMDMYLIEEAVFRAADKAGLRCCGGEAVFAFPSASCPTPDHALDLTRELARRWRDHSRITVAVNPHSVYTTTPEILTRCGALAEELNLPLHIHLAETSSETAQCLKQWGKRPLPYCRDLGLLTSRATLAHMVDLSEEEMDLLAESGAVAVHNPSSNMKLASGVAPVPVMLARNIPVGLGTDGAASNNRLNMFAEMGRAALLHKIFTSDPTALPAQSVLDMTTLGGAAALHQSGLGRLSPGCPADLTALDLAAPNMQPLYAPVSHLVYAATGMETVLTMVEGEILYHNGAFTRFDYPGLCDALRDVRAWVLRKAGRC